MVALPDGEKNFEDMYNRLDSIPACDRPTDRRTDRRTSCDGIVRAMHTRRAVKIEDRPALFVSTECTNVTDTQTDGRTDRHRMTA